jgi:hypothetical protein
MNSGIKSRGDRVFASNNEKKMFGCAAAGEFLRRECGLLAKISTSKRILRIRSESKKALDCFVALLRAMTKLRVTASVAWLSSACFSFLLLSK